MRRRTNISINPKHVYIICSVVCVILIAVSFKFSEQLSPVKTAFGRVFTPMQSGINSVGSSLTSKFDVFDEVGELSKENNKLKEEVKTLEGENRQLLEDKEELERLRKLYKLEDTYAN